MVILAMRMKKLFVKDLKEPPSMCVLVYIHFPDYQLHCEDCCTGASSGSLCVMLKVSLWEDHSSMANCDPLPLS